MSFLKVFVLVNVVLCHIPGDLNQRSWAFADLMNPDGSYKFAKRVIFFVSQIYFIRLLVNSPVAFLWY